MARRIQALAQGERVQIFGDHATEGQFRTSNEAQFRSWGADGEVAVSKVERGARNRSQISFGGAREPAAPIVPKNQRSAETAEASAEVLRSYKRHGKKAEDSTDNLFGRASPTASAGLAYATLSPTSDQTPTAASPSDLATPAAPSPTASRRSIAKSGSAVLVKIGQPIRTKDVAVMDEPAGVKAKGAGQQNIITWMGDQGGATASPTGKAVRGRGGGKELDPIPARVKHGRRAFNVREVQGDGKNILGGPSDAHVKRRRSEPSMHTALPPLGGN